MADTTQTRDETVAELLRDLSDGMTKLVHQEVELAKAELTVKGKRIGEGAGMFGGAALFGVLGLAGLVTAAIAGLATVLATWLAALIVAVALLAVASIAALAGKKEVGRGSPPLPTQAIDSTKEDVAWLKTQAQSARR
ncbi:MAG TPA: phage holin family protein [Acidimicrobiales bacterium]|nr:phage holin family protein [Acidimicrobiales bacterium]